MSETEETKTTATTTTTTEAEKKEEETAPMDMMEAIMTRRSVRNYKSGPSEEQKPAIKKLLEDIVKRPNVFDPEKQATNEGLVALHFVDKDLGFKSSYGVISGSKNWMFGVSKMDEEDKYARQRYGLLFQRAVNELRRMHLGTVWLGGTFGIAPFAEEIGGLKEGERIIAVSPVGVPGEAGMLQRMMTWMVSSSSRKGWETMFFDESFDKPLAKDTVDENTTKALEALRAAPSAVNRQPWRVVRKAGEHTTWHFYTEDYGFFAHVDIGICMANWEMACEELKIAGHWAVLPDVPVDPTTPKNTVYTISWIQE